ncbi:GNAT family N-acetyltransferase [Chryseobacterium sp. RRHN12]|uniref:GNAT family N-acetyltransferase n=1 Tax=Chryseobacterium sp. RRHN12 TaxID=3437884 RepID=UPI003D9BC3B9
MQIIKYRQKYKERCIQIFKTNLPKFFAKEELQQFKEFLDQSPDHYYMVEINGFPVGCGGIYFDERSNEAALCWGMVDANSHGKGIGKFLTRFRLDLLQKLNAGKMITIETSQHTASFYKKNGFTTVDILANGFCDGLDKYIMKIEAKT